MMRQTIDLPVRKSKSRPTSSRGGAVIPDNTSMAVLPPDPVNESSGTSSTRSSKSSSSRPNSSQRRVGSTSNDHAPTAPIRDVVSADSQFTVTPGREETAKSTFMTSQFEEEADKRQEIAEAEARQAAEIRAAEEAAVKAAEKAAALKAAEEAAVLKAAEEAAALKAAEEAAAAAAAEKAAALKAAEEAAAVRAAEEAAAAEAAEASARAVAAEAAAKQALEDELEKAELQVQQAEKEALRVEEAKTVAALELKRYEMAKRVAQKDAEAKQEEDAEAKWRAEVATAAAAAADDQDIPAEEPIQWSEDLKEYVGAEGEEDDDCPAKSYEEIAITVDAFLAMQDSMRTHLQQYCHTLEQQRDDEGNKLIEFPENFADVLEVMQDEARQRPAGLAHHSKWQKYLNDDDDDSGKGKGKDEIERQKKMIQGMRAIQKLDMKLVAKSKEAAELKKLRDEARNPEEDGSSQRERHLARVEDTVKEELRSANWIGKKQYTLSAEEEERVERLLEGQAEEESQITSADGADPTGYSLNCEDHSRLLDIDQAIAAFSVPAPAEAPGAPETHCDGSLVQQALPKSGDATFLQYEREKREESRAASAIERSLHQLQSAAKWPRPEDIDREAVNQVLASCALEEQSEVEKARVSALVAELRAEGNRSVQGDNTGSTPHTTPRLTVETTTVVQGDDSSPSMRSPSRSPQASPSPSGSPVDPNKVRAVKLSRRQLVMINPVLAHSPGTKD